jgi:outer membrane protein assembly factor BamB
VIGATAVAVITALGLGIQSPVDDELSAPAAREREVDASRGSVFSLRWRRPLVRTGIFRTVGTSFGAAAVSRRHGLIIVGTGEGEVRGLAQRDGQVRWSYAHGAPFESNVALITVPGDGRGGPIELAVIGGCDGNLLALEAGTGALRWKATLDGDPRAPARLVGDALVVTTAANKVYHLAAATGAIRWTRGRSLPTGLTIAGHAAATVAEGVVYLSYSDGYAEALRLADGESLWARPLSVGAGEFVDADADPVLANGRLFVASYSDGVYALNPKDGQTLWRRPAPAAAQLAVHDDDVIVASADGWVWALEQKDGALVYRTRLSPGAMSRMVVNDDLVVFTAGDSGLVVLDAWSGKPVQASAYGEPFAGDPVWVADELVFVAASGYVYALERARVSTRP